MAYTSFRKVPKQNEFNCKYREKQMLEFIKDYKADALIRIGNFSTEILWGNRAMMFPAKDKDDKPYKKGMFLFGMVRKDAANFLKNKKNFKGARKYPVNESNEKFDKWEFRITATDLNHAYWRIAYNLGVISEHTYEKGLDDDFKVVRLAALSTLGASKDYLAIKKGKITDEVVTLGGDDNLKTLYKTIRYTCYKFMQEIKKLLGDDFVAYRTDCIYYCDTQENRKMVHDYCKERHMAYKQLYGDRKALYDKEISED